MEYSLPQELFDALKENNKVLEESSQIISKNNENKEKKEVSEKNIVKSVKINTSLSSDEKRRYSLIGEEFFKPLFKKFSDLKKQESMLIKNDMDLVSKNLKKQYTDKSETKKGASKLWTFLFLGAAAIIAFKDKIAFFFKELKDKVTSKITDVITKIKEAFTFPDLTELTNEIKNFWNSGVTKISDISSNVSEFVKNSWNNFWNGVGLDIDLEEELKKIPDAIAGALEFIAKGLRNLFESEDDDTEQENSKSPDTNQNNIPIQPPFSPEEIKAKREIEAATRSFQDYALSQVHAIDSVQLKEYYTKTLPADIKSKLDEMKLSVVMKDNDIDLDIAQDEYKKNISNIISGFALTGVESEKRQDNILEVIESKIKDLNFQQPLDEESYKQLLSDIKKEANIKILDESSILDKFREINTNFSRVSQFKDHLQMTKMLNSNDDKAFDMALNHAKFTDNMLEFRFKEARAVILSTTKQLVESFNSFSKKTVEGLIEGISGNELFKHLISLPEINVSTVPNVDNSTNNYEILALDETKIGAFNDKVIELTTKSAENIEKQNSILMEIKNKLSLSNKSNQNSNPSLFYPIVNKEKSNESSINAVLNNGRALVNNLLANSTPLT